MEHFQSYLRMMIDTHHLREGALKAAIKALELPDGSHGLDAGCGLGLLARIMAQEIGGKGHVTGIDINEDFLQYATESAKKDWLAHKLSFQYGDVNKLPFDDNTFDWVCSTDCIGYAPMEPLPIINELIRVVKPGGQIAILAWTNEKLLPGYPALEAKLSATTAGIAPFLKDKKPEKHILRAMGWFREAGLTNCCVQTFAGDAFAPLNDQIRRALEDLFQMRWPGVESELSEEDTREYKRLCSPDSPDFILKSPDYYAFFNYSMFTGRVVD